MGEYSNLIQSPANGTKGSRIGLKPKLIEVLLALLPSSVVYIKLLVGVESAFNKL